MSSSNGEGTFEVHMSKHIANQLKNLLKGSPRGTEIVASLQRINDRLERDPWNFGEQRYHLHEARLQIRIAVVSPVAVEYGVHMDRPIVFIRTVVALAGA